MSNKNLYLEVLLITEYYYKAWQTFYAYFQHYY